MSDLRVLAICYEDPADILGGMGMHIRELYRAMAKRGDVTIDLLVDGRLEESVDYYGCTKHHSSKLVCWKPQSPDFVCMTLLDIQMARTITKLIAEGKRWDVVHCHEWSAVQIARMVRDALGIPMVSTMHLCLSYLSAFEGAEDFDITQLGESDLYMMQQEGHLVSDPSALILCSKAYVDIVRAQFLIDRPIDMIYNGINQEEWNPRAGDRDRACALFGLSTERPIALYVGRIATMKGIVHLLDAVESQDLGYQVVYVGEVNANSERDAESWDVTKRLRRQCSLYPERAKWVKFQHGQSLRDLYAAADVVVMPSTHEPFGIVALEAMAMGTPLIATEVDGLKEIVIDEAGDEYAMVIPPGRPDMIAAALRDLLDEDKREELARLGLQRVNSFSWDEAAARTVDIYRRVSEGYRYDRTHTES